ncbi:cold-shock protein [Rhizobium sp. SYY.PMSO]|uniref:cold-shock protein n=1 Tax=Rhizobium sp. SYY.PMSO TaxID=3382192 RepID=UPI0039902ABF
MRHGRYQAGDMIVLKAGVLGNAHPKGEGRVLSCLPEAGGLAHYRVRFENESFERSIRQDDIDPATSQASFDGAPGTPKADGSRWVNLNSIRTKK